MSGQNQLVGVIARGLTNGGVGRFISEVLFEWNKTSSKKDELLIFTDERSFINKYKNLKIIYIPKAPKIVWDNILLLIKIIQYKPTSVLYTKNVIPVTHLLGRWQRNVAVYDLGYFYQSLNAYKMVDTLYMKIMMRLTLPFANKIISISKFTKSEIIKFFKIPELKIKVIYLGVSKSFRKVRNKKILNSIRNKYRLKEPFIFYAGSLSPRKNILRLVMAFHKIQDKIPHTLYLICGKRWNTSNIFKYIQDNNLGNRVVILPFISEDELLSFYSLSSAFIYPSLYEGFGLPIIEAQVCECPVLTSSTTSCGEIVGDAALTCDPLSVRDISEKLEKILSKKKMNQYYLSPKIIRQKYNWKKTAKKILMTIAAS